MLLFDRYHDIGTLILHEIVAKLGPNENMPNNIYYARFIMLLINHLVPNVQINQPNNKWNCWVQSKRVIKDIFRANLNNDVGLVYPPLIQVFLSAQRVRLPPSSNPLFSSIATVAMGTGNDPQFPTQATKTKKVSKLPIRKPTSNVSQKTFVAKTTISQPEGSD